MTLGRFDNPTASDVAAGLVRPKPIRASDVKAIRESYNVPASFKPKGMSEQDLYNFSVKTVVDWWKRNQAAKKKQQEQEKGTTGGGQGGSTAKGGGSKAAGGKSVATTKKAPVKKPPKGVEANTPSAKPPIKKATTRAKPTTSLSGYQREGGTRYASTVSRPRLTFYNTSRYRRSVLRTY